MLDTNLCIRALRDRPPEIRERLKAEYDTVCISAVVRYELYVGIALAQGTARERREIDEFLSPFACLPFDDEAAFHAADIRVDLTRKGQLIGPNDLLIAGHARSLGLKVITGNLREFQRVEGLRSEDWL
ncbi:type II toxin-antitoxin system VapC family toxin [Novosphingobium sp. G106]|nr:type II toxin-antitoxin system VapC family toxin [Novosphingobium sp. G106]